MNQPTITLQFGENWLTFTLPLLTLCAHRPIFGFGPSVADLMAAGQWPYDLPGTPPLEAVMLPVPDDLAPSA